MFRVTLKVQGLVIEQNGWLRLTRDIKNLLE